MKKGGEREGEEGREGEEMGRERKREQKLYSLYRHSISCYEDE